MVRYAGEQLTSQANGNINYSVFGSVIYNVKAYLATGNGTTNDTSRIIATISEAAHQGGIVFFPPGTYLTDSFTVPSNVTVWFANGAKLSINSGKIVTINGPIDAGLYQIFSGLGTVSGAMDVPQIYPQWWGAKGDGSTDDTTPIQKTIEFCGAAGGGIVFLPGSVNGYLISSTITIKHTNVTIQGAGMRDSMLMASPSFTGLYMVDVDPINGAGTFFASFCMLDCGLNVNGTNLRGLHLASLRDGTVLSRVFISEFQNTAVHVNKSLKASAMKNQGLSFYDVHMITSLNIAPSISVFVLDDANETGLYNCKTLGVSSATNQGVGFHIGPTAQCDTGSMENCSSAHFNESGGMGFLFESCDFWSMYNCKGENNETSVQLGLSTTVSPPQRVRSYGMSISTSPTAVYFRNAVNCDFFSGLLIGLASGGINAIKFGPNAITCQFNGRFNLAVPDNVVFEVGQTNCLVTGYFNKRFMIFSNNEGGIMFYDGVEVFSGAGFLTTKLSTTNNQYRLRNAASTTLHSIDSTGKGYFLGEIEIDGALNHDGNTVGFYGTTPVTKPTVSGSRGGNVALASLLTQLAALGLITDSTSA